MSVCLDVWKMPSCVQDAEAVLLRFKMASTLKRQHVVLRPIAVLVLPMTRTLRAIADGAAKLALAGRPGRTERHSGRLSIHPNHLLHVHGALRAGIAAP